MPVFAFMNLKGGVGKTVLAANLASVPTLTVDTLL